MQKKTKHLKSIAESSLIRDWDFIRNTSVMPEDVTLGSNRFFWWICANGHHRYKAPNAIWDSNDNRPRACGMCRAPRESFGSIALGDFLLSEGYAIERESSVPLEDHSRVDIFLPRQKIAIEFNGEYWHSTEVIMPKYGITAEEFHHNRKQKAMNNGVLMAYVWNGDWIDKNEEVKRDLLYFIETKEFTPLLTRLSSSKTYTKEDIQRLRKKFNQSRKPKETPSYIKKCNKNIDLIRAKACDPQVSFEEIAVQINVPPTSLKRFVKDNNIFSVPKIFPNIDIEELKKCADNPNVTAIETCQKFGIADFRTVKKMMNFYGIDWKFATKRKYILLNHIDEIKKCASTKGISQKETARKLGTTQPSLASFCCNHQITWIR